jgi:hypothetical protein
MLKFIYRLRSSATHGAATVSEASDDPFAHPAIASMDLRMLADLPPDELHECKAAGDAERRRSAEGLSCTPKSCAL